MTRWHYDEVHPKSLLERLRYMHAHRLSPEQASRLTPRQRDMLKSELARVKAIATHLDNIRKIDMSESAGFIQPLVGISRIHAAADSPLRMLSDLRTALEC